MYDFRKQEDTARSEIKLLLLTVRKKQYVLISFILSLSLMKTERSIRTTHFTVGMKQTASEYSYQVNQPYFKIKPTM